MAAGSVSTIVFILSIFSFISSNLSELNLNFSVRSSEDMMMGDIAIASRRLSRACSAASRRASLSTFFFLHL